MIAAAISTLGSEDATERLARLGRAAGLADGRSVSVLSGAVMAWRGYGESFLGHTSAIAWTGPPRAVALDPSDAATLRGDFSATALLDNRLMLARGLFGGRPLFYAWECGRKRLVACSRLAPLVATLDPPPSLKIAEIASLVAFGFSGIREQTPFNEIFRVEAGAILEVSETQIVRRGQIEFRPRRLHCGSVDAYARELKRGVSEAVKRATRGATRIGVMVSGGVDSSVVLASAIAQERGANRREVEAITLDFAAEHSDQPYLRDLMNAFGIIPFSISPAACAFRAADVLVMDGAACPWPSASAAAGLMVAAKERGADVVLTGLGGDELLDGDLRIFAARALRGDIFGAAFAAARLKAMYWQPSPYGRIDQLVTRPVAKALLPKRVVAAIKAARSFGRSNSIPLWAGPRLKEFLSREVVRDWAPPPEESPSGEARIHALARCEYLIDHADTRGQLETYAECSRRDIFWDQDLAELVASIPPEVLMHEHRLRGLVRYAFSGVIPDRIRLRESKGQFEPAFAVYLRAMQRSGTLDSLAKMSALSQLGVIRRGAYQEAMRRLIRDPSDGRLTTKLWPVLAVEAFARRHLR